MSLSVQRALQKSTSAFLLHTIPYSRARIYPVSSVIQAHINKAERIWLEKKQVGKTKDSIFKSSLYQQWYIDAAVTPEKINPKLKRKVPERYQSREVVHYNQKLLWAIPDECKTVSDFSPAVTNICVNTYGQSAKRWNGSQFICPLKLGKKKFF